MTRSENGFTLLEVLAAVALLGILYTVLAGVAMQGLRGEGIARRRLEASLLADEILSDMERELVQGVTPPPGVTEEDRDAFHVTVEVAPFEPPEGLFDEPEKQTQTQTNPAPGAAPLPQLPSLLELPGPGQPPVVVTVELEVSWEEGDQTFSVQRSTFGYNVTALSGALVPAQGQP